MPVRIQFDTKEPVFGKPDDPGDAEKFQREISYVLYQVSEAAKEFAANRIDRPGLHLKDSTGAVIGEVSILRF